MRLQSLVTLIAIPTLVLAAACGGGGGGPATEEEAAGAAEEAPEAAEKTTEVRDGGTISGSVEFTGSAPEAQVIQMSADPFCMQAHEGETVTTRRVLVNENGTLRNVFVWIKEGLSGEFPAPSEAAVLDQEGCRYAPHVIGLQAGQALTIVNSDNTLHNINAQPQNNDPFNIAQPVQGMETERNFSNPEVMIPVKCDVHPWMNAYIGIVDHPYFSVTDESGSFTMADVPAGDYVVEAWHEQFGSQTQNVTVEADGTVEASFTFGG